MEIEYKWILPITNNNYCKNIIDTTCGDIISVSNIEMSAIYYDTPDRLLFTHNISLRIRTENQSSICCLKILKETKGACKEREEYEVQASDVYEGLSLLLHSDGPEDLCNSLLFDHNLTKLCRIEFHRTSIRILYQEGIRRCISEISFDVGYGFHEGKRVKISEIELEYIEGDVDLFSVFAAEIERRHNLSCQPLSKIAQTIIS